MRLLFLFLFTFAAFVTAAEQENDKYSPPNCKVIAEWVDLQKQRQYKDNIKLSDYPKLNIYDIAIAIYINRKMPSSASNTYASAYINCRAIIAGNVVVQPD
ncbi:hypothetical protein [Thalassotalea litorea]|uniref:hypothetical protein n=1 Tax=Thalassotalea litorea TaxID=2020715 RepID=UPI003735C15C